MMLSMPMLCMNQKRTQSNAGGMTEVYLESGTYLKSFYSVIYHPAGVRVKLMTTKFVRLHHAIGWRYTAPLIVRERGK